MIASSSARCLLKPKRRRHHVERPRPSKGSTHACNGLQRRSRPQCANMPMRCAIHPDASRLTMPKPSISDSIRAGCRSVAEVAAVRDDVHRHGHAAGQPGDHDKLENARRNAGATWGSRHRVRAAASWPGRGTAAQHQCQGQHRHQAEEARYAICVCRHPIASRACRSAATRCRRGSCRRRRSTPPARGGARTSARCRPAAGRRWPSCRGNR